MTREQEAAQFLQVYHKLPKTSQASMKSVIQLLGAVLWEQVNKVPTGEKE